MSAFSKRGIWLVAGALTLAVVIGIVSLQLAQTRTPVAHVAKQIRVRVQQKDFRLRAHGAGDAARLWDLTREFYGRRRYRPAWVSGRGPEPQASELLQALGEAGRDGLDPRDYDYQLLVASKEELDPGLLGKPAGSRELADYDLRMTWAFFHYAHHLLNGLVPRQAIDPEWVTSPRKFDLAGQLERAVRHGGVKELLAELLPRDPAYARLREAAVRYATIASQGGWPALRSSADLRPGRSGPRVALLERRLALEGDLSDTSASPRYDARLAEGVKRFQARHGLEPSGAIDAATLAALDVPAAARMRQIQLNLERWRWLPPDLGPRYVMINIPDFCLDVMENGRSALAMRVVVGKVSWPTPVFSDRITALELNPYWNVPPNIARAEILPALAQDPDYLARHNMRVVRADGDSQQIDPGSIDWEADSYRFRQEPGPDNPLGQIKFLLPNEYDVYLHDTPAGHLFNQRERGFSHGCIRLEHPFELADYLMKGSRAVSSGGLRELAADGEHKTVPLPRDVPVHILYWTAWADADGTVQFREDVYGVDQRLDAAIKRGAISNFRLNVSPSRSSA